MTAEQIAYAAGAPIARFEPWVGPLDEAFTEFNITGDSILFLLANVLEETQRFTRFQENLNYSDKGLAETWPHRFSEPLGAAPFTPNARARELEHDPIRIAEAVYGGRMGNGPEGSGDGHKYRGHYLPMLTGLDAYKKASADLGVDLVSNPDAFLADLKLQSRIAAWFWTWKGCWAAEDFPGCVKMWNGGEIGLADRTVLLEMLRRA